MNPRMANSLIAFRWRYWLPRIATSIFVPLLIIGIIEISLRAFGVGSPTDVTVPCKLQGRAASCYNLSFITPFFPPGMIRTPQLYAIPDEKSQNTFRIVVLGESAAMGDPDPAYAFSRYLEVMLRERFPSMKFEVINTGSVAINSHVLLPIAKGLAKFHPDLFIIYSGNNEVVGPYGPGTALMSASMSLPVIRTSIFLRSTRIGQLLARVGTQKREWGGMEMFLDKQVRASSPLMEHTYENFDSNLRDTIAVARSSGARVIVSTVATNVKDCAPFASLHRKDLGQDALRSWTSLVQQGSALENGGYPAEALRRYLAATEIDDQYAELEFRIAHCLSMLGDYQSARVHYLRARDLDTLRFRADSKINEINRSVASSSGAELVDAEAIFANASSGGVVGSDLVYEHVHPTPEGNYLLARSMFLQVVSKMAPTAGQSEQNEDILSQNMCERLLALTSHDRARISTVILLRQNRPPFTTQLNHAEQVWRLNFMATAGQETPEQTAPQYQWAIARWPDDWMLHYNYGHFLFDIDHAAAIEQFRIARPWDGAPISTPDGKQID
jgi:tetratricopeptide (TPR) repeat protein